jgi:hypothetical protein
VGGFMGFWKFIKPDRKVLNLFSILFTLSIIASFFILGHPGHLYYEAGCSEYFGYVRGIGLPFGWADLHFAPIPHCNGTQCVTVACYYPPVLFDPINFILDLIILYIMALLIARVHDKYFKKKKKR